MNNEFCTYKQSLALKELGFDELCLGFYERNKELIIQECEVTDFHKSSLQCTAPLKQQAFKFFREKYGHYSEIRVGCTQIDGSIGYEWWIWEPNGIEEWSPEAPGEEWSYDTYEDAENTCLDKLIEIVKNKK
jgi:hypothetical protein